MEKSFLNFKAAHPEWTPTDPSGSLYLSRIADFSAAHPVGLGRRRLLRRPSDSSQTGQRPAFGQESAFANTGQDPVGAMRQSQAQTLSRRRGGALVQSTRSGFGLGTGTGVAGETGGGASTIFQSTTGMEMAQTAVLGDSQGSVMPLNPAAQVPPSTSIIPEEELAPDGGVGSMLGESYVDGKRPSAGGQSQMQDEDEGLDDGGVLGLLAQIYGTGANVKGRGRGPPRAI